MCDNINKKRENGDESMKILNFGSGNIDFVYSLEHIVSPGETEVSEDMNIFPGGKGLNQSIALARAGAKVYHAGCFGTDGAMLLKLLGENGVNTNYSRRENCKNGHAIIQVGSDGENSIFIYPGSNAMITNSYVDSVLKNFGKDDFIILQNEINNLNYIIECAFKRGMKIVLNPSPCDEKLKNIDYKMLTYLILNEIEAKIMSDCDNFDNAAAYFLKKNPQLNVLITLGKNGCIFYNGTVKIFQPSFSVETVDTTAAGDTFTGYFIAMVSNKKDYKSALRISSAASALAVSKKGAAPSIPYIDDVLNSIDTLCENINGKSRILKEKISVFIKQNIKNVTIKDIARELGYSQSYTQAVVKNIYGEPVSKLIQTFRCEAAAEALKNTDLPISEVINSVGYENESFFRRVFKEKYGKNLLEFRHDFQN